MQYQEMDIEAIALPTPKEFISLHGWMLSQLNLSKIVSPHLSAEQNCKSVLKYIDNFPWAADAKESVEEYIEMPVTTCLSPTNSSSSSSDLQPAASEADAQVLKTPSGFDKRRLKLYKNSEFACEPCGRNFGTKSSYTQHCKAYHSGPMEHRCGQCGKRFNTEAKMKMHERLHTMKDKPFKCQQCSSQFIYSHDLKRHEMKRHGQGNGFVCKICGLKCSRPDILALHEIRHTRKTGK